MKSIHLFKFLKPYGQACCFLFVLVVVVIKWRAELKFSLKIALHSTLVMRLSCIARFLQSLVCSIRKSSSDTTIFTIIALLLLFKSQKPCLRRFSLALNRHSKLGRNYDFLVKINQACFKIPMVWVYKTPRDIGRLIFYTDFWVIHPLFRRPIKQEGLPSLSEVFYEVH